MSVREFTEGCYIMQSFDFFQMKCCAKYDFLEIYEIFNIANSTNRSSYPEVFLGKGV